MAWNQVIAATGLSGSTFTSVVIDVSTGATLSTHKGGWVAQPGTMCQLSGHWAAAEQHSPVIHFWPQHKGKNSQEIKIICPGRVTAMSLAGDFCFAGIGEKVYVWQVSTGQLFTMVENCFQPISALKVNPIGDVLAAGSEDGSVTFWSIKTLSQQPCISTQSASPEPVASFSSHTAAVTDISFVSRNGCASVSRDGKCCMYDLSRKVVTFQVSFDGNALYSVAMDRAKYRLFVGSETGEIHETRMFSKSESGVTSGSSGGDGAGSSPCSFIGHSLKVTCLDVTIDGLGLVSGSADGTIRLWNIQSKQCIRSSALKDHIGSVQIMTLSQTPDTSAKCLIAHRFERSVARSVLNQSAVAAALQQVNGQSHPLNSSRNEDPKRKSKASDPSVLLELEKQKKINRELYNLYVRKEFIAAFSNN